MESLKRADSNLSISSIASDYNVKEDESEITAKSNAIQKILIEAATETSAENAALASEITELLSVLGIDLKSLPPDIKDGLQIVAAILKSEGLTSVDETTLELCLEKKEFEKKKKEREERLMKATYSAAFTKYNSFGEKLNELRNAIEQVEDDLRERMSNSENEESNRILLTSRLQDYKDTVKKLEEEMDDLQISEIGLEPILQKYSILMEKSNELIELDKELSKYNNLPPNLLQAKNVLENKKKELEAIENALHERLNL